MTPRGNPAAFGTIDRDDLVELLSSSAPVALVEALGGSYFADAHLPGAVNIPPQFVDTLAPVLIPDRRQVVIVYCSGTCTSSQDTARRLVELGYESVLVYEGGKEDWVEAGLPVERDDG